MRKEVIFAVLLGVVAATTFDTALTDEERCLGCIRDYDKVDLCGSQSDEKLCSGGHFPRLTMKYDIFQQCGEGHESWSLCAHNFECATRCLKAYVKRFAHRCFRNMTDCETIARLNIGGSKGCTGEGNSRNKEYWTDIKRCYEN
ncbi:hypothetical protein PMAYCL1PPCAC_08086 [Pristionchus mayeri]|uniref:lysozyme n=1 Tax=Pristionchus mayeri TaxID=1317129 RepID=A0AAN4ZBW7_9BILA|nr:hypothetical protein PMAYCL1PPCAC_08086 [Pristionchus mayeri]